MSRWKPCKRHDFIRKCHVFGFEGPYSGSRHRYMVYDGRRLTLPSNPEYPVPQLRRMIRQIEVILGREISAEEWESL